MLLEDYKQGNIVTSCSVTCHAPVDPENLTTLLQKDSNYNAVGLAAFDLHDDIDFDSWLTRSLSLELSVGECSYRYGIKH